MKYHGFEPKDSDALRIADRNNILDAAHEIILNSGCEKLSEGAICEISRVSMEAIRYNFNSICEIATEIILRARGNSISTIRQLTQTLPPAAALREAISWLMDRHLGGGGYGGLAEVLPLACGTAANDAEMCLAQTLSNLLKITQNGGFVRKSLDAHNTAQRILEMTNDRTLFLKSQNDIEFFISLKKDTLRALFLNDGDIE